MSTPYRCPDCNTDDGFWAYGRLVFEGETNPTCAICKGPILPCSAFRMPKALTGINRGVYSRQVAIPLLSADQAGETPNATPTNRVGARAGHAASGVEQ